MKAKNTKTIKNFFIGAFVIFLALPIIFPETNPIKVLKKENTIKSEESPLPIFSKDNALTNYVKRLKQFYTLEKQEEFSKETNANQNDNINSNDLFFTTDNDEDNPALFADAGSAVDRANSVDLENGTVLTKDGLLLSPTQDGYYFQGKFYKNGTYPQNSNKTAIEGALSRYHTAVAKSSGKKAIYSADEKGNLTVAYVQEYPDTVFGNIKNYLAQSSGLGNDGSTFAKAGKTDYDKYRGATINGLNNKSGYNSKGNEDIAKTSLTDMHSAYSVALRKIKSGELLKENEVEKPENIVNKPLINAINQMPAAENPTAGFSPENFCKEDECENAFTIAPQIEKQGYSDLYNYYHSFCEDLPSCPPFTNIFHANHDVLSNFNPNDPNDMERLKSDIEQSEKNIIEIGYMHLTPENMEYYTNLLQELNDMELTNSKNEKVEVRLRGFNFHPEDPGSNFGEKLIAPMHKNITRDIPNEDVFSLGTKHYNPIGDLAGQYQEIYENVQDEYEGNEALHDVLTTYKIKEDPKNMPIAIVQKSFIDTKSDTFVVNSSFIPGGYRTEIPEWEKYLKNTKYGTYYEVPREVLLNNSPKNLAIIFLQQDEKDGGITLSDDHPITTMSVREIFNFNKGQVHDNVKKIYETQAITAIHNAKQQGSPTTDIGTLKQKRVETIPAK